MKPGDYDVVIVGSGAGGGAMAHAYCVKKVRVLVLEAGPRFDPFKDYKLDQEDWERHHFPHKPGSEGRYSYGPMQELEARWDDLRSWNRVMGRTNRTKHRKVFKYHHVRGVGGSTLTFTGEAHRMHPEAMKMRSRFKVAADWPLSYSDLEPFYCEAERLVGVAGPQDAGVRWRSQPYPLPAHPLNYASQRLQAGAKKLGLEWVANPRAALSKPYDDRPNCNYCANCSRGCPRTDKGSVDVTFLRKAEASGFCKVESGVTVTRIEPGADDRVKGIHLIDAGGKEQFLPTPQLVIACGAVETPRLLLASANQHAPDGLANESGQVGRHFMETLSWSSSALHADALGSFRGLPSDSVCWDFNAPDAVSGIVGGCRFYTGTLEAGLNGPVGYAQRVVGSWGRAHKTAMRQSFGHALTVAAIGESLPNKESFVDLDPQSKDSHGVPLARIHSKLQEPELKRLAFMAKKNREILHAAGTNDLVEEYGSYDSFSATHVFGTCRMGADQTASVVDALGRSFRWKNLRIMDASVFPSSGGGESPSLTIQALALRSVAHS